MTSEKVCLGAQGIKMFGKAIVDMTDENDKRNEKIWDSVINNQENAKKTWKEAGFECMNKARQQGIEVGKEKQMIFDKELLDIQIKAGNYAYEQGKKDGIEIGKELERDETYKELDELLKWFQSDEAKERLLVKVRPFVEKAYEQGKKDMLNELRDTKQIPEIMRSDIEKAVKAERERIINEIEKVKNEQEEFYMKHDDEDCRQAWAVLDDILEKLRDKS